MNNGDQSAFEEAWLKRLIDGAKVAGPIPISAAPKQTPLDKTLKLKQSTLTFTKDMSTKEEKQAERQKRIQKDKEEYERKQASLAAEKKKAEEKKKETSQRS
ncbi:hypothetical protein BT96DRAFT_950186 [Gymnopus androsaceus JB14]|uniref:Uncharacterized protein n=1 Tax=Gymnopus androsaceus JB14 TaxID=1447944 RepID=A0A6A4GHW5_9AGAR|nr:hypothetical protein BT96DRAFT_950186 [Gymnopus androsaceus JB14]